MNALPTQPIYELSAAPRSPFRKSIWWWIAFVFTLLCGAVLLWWGGSFVYHLITFHPKGQIVFSCWSSRCQVNADGSEQKKIADVLPIPLPKGISGYGIFQSPNKKHLAFQKLDDKANFLGLFVVNQDGKNETFLMKDVADYDWSPDSTKIAFTAYLGSSIDTLRIFVINVDGSNRRQLTNEWSDAPAWSPDGAKIVYSYRGDLWIMNPDGSGQTQLTHMNTYFSYGANAPSWSPDGQYIVYWSHNPFCLLCPGTGQLWVVHADGSDPTRITNGQIDQNPVWQPAP